MAASLLDIKRWVKEGSRKKGTTHVLIVCDCFDYEDYPVYVSEDEDVRMVAQQNNGPNMTRLMEVYSLTGKHTIEDQFKQGGRVFNYD